MRASTAFEPEARCEQTKQTVLECTRRLATTAPWVARVSGERRRMRREVALREGEEAKRRRRQREAEREAK